LGFCNFFKIHPWFTGTGTVHEVGHEAASQYGSATLDFYHIAGQDILAQILTFYSASNPRWLVGKGCQL
jgi:hypothetical protein